MRINDLINNNIQNGAGSGINSDLSLIDGADSVKNKTTALLDGNKGAVGFFKQDDSRISGILGATTYSLNEAKGVGGKRESLGEKIINGIGLEQNNDKELVKNLTGDDYESLTDEGMSIEKFSRERLEKAIERIKENRSINESRLEESVEKRHEFNASVERMAVYSSLESGTDKLIAKMLYDADIPVTEENIERVKEAGERAKAAENLSDSSESYLIKNRLAPTIDNIYKASYAGEMRLYTLPDSSWENLKEKAADIVDQTGLNREDGLKAAKWLIEHDLPVTEGNILYKSGLDDLRNEMPGGDKLIKAAVQAMEKGGEALDGLLIRESSDDGALIQSIQDTVNKLQLIGDTEIKAVCAENENIDGITLQDLIFAGDTAEQAAGSRAGDITGNGTVVAAGDANYSLTGSATGLTGEISKADGSMPASVRLSDSEATVKIRLEEIRYSLTIEAGRRLMSNGIDIMTDGMRNVLDGIRELQAEFYKGVLKEIEAGYGKNMEIDEAKIDSLARLAADTENSLRVISSAPLELYKATYSVRHSVTLAELSEDGELITKKTVMAAAGSVGSGLGSMSGGSGNARQISINPASMKNALSYYEESSTEIRKDLGDSIKKAFSGSVDSLITSNGLEITEGNRRAVRILGYNSMEINAESIENIKYYDAKVTGLVERMTPPVVMAMIRDGINPLESTIDELDDIVSSIIKEQGSSLEQKYSEFLVRMEETGSITENERNAYIGIYRLLYNVEKNDGAAIGSLLNSGRELSFRNLMTEVRSMNSNIELSAGDDTKVRGSHYLNSVTAQIDDAFVFQRGLVRDSLNVTEPSAWEKALSGKNYADVTIEELHDGLVSRYTEVSSEDLGQKAALIAKTMMNTGTVPEFLNSFGITDSFENRTAAEDVFKNPEKEDSAFDFSVEELDDALDSFSKFDELLGIKTRMANALTGEAFRTAITAQSAAELNSRVERIEMLQKLAGKGHYRMNISDSDEAKTVNLTLISNTDRNGTVSVQISKPDYNIQADLNMVIMESDRTELPDTSSGEMAQSGISNSAEELRIQSGSYGTSGMTMANAGQNNAVTGARIYVSGKSVPDPSELKERIIQVLKNNGINADNINIVPGIRNNDAYLSYLARQAAENRTVNDNYMNENSGVLQSGRTIRSSDKKTEGLFRAAKSLLAAL